MYNIKQLVIAAAIGTAVAASGACHRANRQEPSPTGAIALSVRNNAFFDVIVYALPSTGTATRIRIATVTGHSDADVTVAQSALRPGGVLVVYLHAIGSRYSWTSPAVMVDPSQRTCLDIHANPDGNLNRSSLYVMAGPIAGVERTSAPVGIAPPAAGDPGVETGACWR